MKWKNLLRKKPQEQLTQCLNCGQSLTPEDLYCSKCGQKAMVSKIGFFSLLGTFLSSVMNLDGSLWSTLGGIFRPGYLSKKFIEGERKSYLHPMRLFFFTLVIHFALLGAISDTDQFTNMQRQVYTEYDKTQMYDRYQTIMDSVEIDTMCYSTVEEHLFDGTKTKEQDSIPLNMNIPNIWVQSLTILRSDLIDLPVDSIYQKYEITSLSQKVIVRQTSRVMRDISGAAKYVVGNILWAVIVALFLVAWLMKIIYVRKGRLYVEHAVVLSHIHSFAFIVASLFFAAILVIDDPQTFVNDYGPWIVGIVIIYSIWAFRVYYQQGIIKTLIKLFMIGIAYMLTITLSFVLVLLISLLFV